MIFTYNINYLSVKIIMRKHQVISKTEADYLQKREEICLEGQPWTFYNFLPIDVYVFIKKPGLEGLFPVGEIVAGKKVEALDHLLEKGDEVHVLRKHGNRFIQTLRPVFLRADSRVVILGDVVSDSRNVQLNDIHVHNGGVRVHNYITLPLQIFCKGSKIGETDVDDGMEYMSGSKNSVYLNNDNWGYKLGCDLDFKLGNKAYASVLLNDNFATDIYVGVITQKFVPPPPDTYGYVLNHPNIIGIPYFETNMAYSTCKTNAGLLGN
jgi:hypothetical protein